MLIPLHPLDPLNPTLPFFAYGIFKPNELAYWLLAPHVINSQECTINGSLFIYDGLPFLNSQRNLSTQVVGKLLYFSPSKKSDAYKQIREHGLQNHYQLKVIQVGTTTANCLVRNLPAGVGRPFMGSEWKGKKDPLFTTALEVVKDLVQTNRVFQNDLKPLFALEAAYLLLWSSIERYVSWRHYLGGIASSEKVLRLAGEQAFITALSKTVSETREIREAADPRKKLILDSHNPRQSLGYYYKIRSNLVHQGKSDEDDHERLLKSTGELLAIFREVLEASFTTT